ncbi:S8 family peptidase [Actinoplanes sp. NPDC051343]|uniref:S8 family peptidase n=1 Tax=Actinoplanes sp. NPDC051343 TaxID=3363906 RepID=UPI00379708D5
MPEATSFPNPWAFDPRVRYDGSVYYLAGEVLVGAEPEGPRVVSNRLREFNAVQIDEDNPLSEYVTRWVLPPGRSVTRTLRELRSLPGETRVGVNHVYAASRERIPVIGQPKLHGGAGDDPVPAPEVVASGSGGRVVRVAVVDTGLDPNAMTLPLFRDHQRHGVHEPDAVYENAAARQIGLMGGHGTVVAGIIARYAPEVHLSSIQVLSVAGITDDVTLANAVQRAFDGGAEIVNLSLGCVYDGSLGPLALDAVLSNRPAGTVVVAAAGNVEKPEPNFYPADRSDVIAVAAMNTAVVPAVPAGFSNTAPWVDVCAPGVMLHSTYVVGTWRYGATPQTFNGYVAWSGTSFATPYVVARIASTTGAGQTAEAAANNLLTLPPLHGVPGYGLYLEAPPDPTL